MDRPFEGSKKAKGVSRIYLPGEIEFEKEKKSLTEGIELSDSTCQQFEPAFGENEKSVEIEKGIGQG